MFPNNNVMVIFSLLKLTLRFSSSFLYNEILFNTKVVQSFCYVLFFVDKIFRKQGVFLEQNIKISALEHHSMFIRKIRRTLNEFPLLLVSFPYFGSSNH